MFVTNVAISGCTPIINKMAFHPDTQNIIAADNVPPGVRELYIETEDEVTIHSYLIPTPSSSKILIYFHGNGGNLCHRLPDLLHIKNMGINVLGVSYRGYGKSAGKPSEKGIYRDGIAALNYATQTLGFPLQNVTVLGRSIGTTVAVHITQNIDIGGLILVTPLTSAKDFAKKSGLGWVAFIAGSAFDNIGKAKHITCPVLVIHGTHDGIIPFEMGKKVYDTIGSGTKKFVVVNSAGHNNLSLEYAKDYFPPIAAFLSRLE